MGPVDSVKRGSWDIHLYSLCSDKNGHLLLGGQRVEADLGYVFMWLCTEKGAEMQRIGAWCAI